MVIQDLDPGLSYSVSVAANNPAGRGSYSDEITVGCKRLNCLICMCPPPRTHAIRPLILGMCARRRESLETILHVSKDSITSHIAVFENCRFQLFLSGRFVCQEWVVSCNMCINHNVCADIA